MRLFFPPRERFLRAAVRLGFELLVIFMAVSAAFLVEGYRQEQVRSDRAAAIYRALALEVGNFTEHVPRVVSEMTRHLEEWEARRNRGQRPPPAFYREPGGERAPTAMWEATLTSGGVNLLDPDLMYALALYYNRVNSLSDRYARYNSFTEAEVLPNMGRGSSAFYDADSGELRTEYRAHMELLVEIRDELAATLEDAEMVLSRIRREMTQPQGDPSTGGALADELAPDALP